MSEYLFQLIFAFSLTLSRLLPVKLER